MGIDGFLLNVIDVTAIGQGASASNDVTFGPSSVAVSCSVPTAVTATIDASSVTYTTGLSGAVVNGSFINLESGLGQFAVDTPAFFAAGVTSLTFDATVKGPPDGSTAAVTAAGLVLFTD